MDSGAAATRSISPSAAAFIEPCWSLASAPAPRAPARLKDWRRHTTLQPHERRRAVDGQLFRARFSCGRRRYGRADADSRLARELVGSAGTLAAISQDNRQGDARFTLRDVDGVGPRPDIFL